MSGWRTRVLVRGSRRRCLSPTRWRPPSWVSAQKTLTRMWKAGQINGIRRASGEIRFSEADLRNHLTGQSGTAMDHRSRPHTGPDAVMLNTLNTSNREMSSASGHSPRSDPKVQRRGLRHALGRDLCEIGVTTPPPP